MVVPVVGQAQEFVAEDYRYRVVTVTDKLNYPWGMVFLPNGDMLITEKPGNLRMIKEGVLLREPVKNAPDAVQQGQGGMLGIALHPKFKRNRLVYISYSGRGEGGVSTEVARGKLVGSALQNLEVIFKAKPKTSAGHHFGSRLLFLPDGTLLVTLGDRGDKDQAQNLANHKGVIVRINDDGSIPANNPFVGRKGVLPEIYTYGNRNVQGIALEPNTKRVWAHEHGPRGGDEVNIIKKGVNYGWPKITYGIGYSGAIISDKTHMKGMAQPVIYWDPSIAPCGMDFYTGDKFAKWNGNIFVGALAGQHLRRLVVKGDKIVKQENLLEGLGERIRDVQTGLDGYIYVLTDNAYGRLLRLEPM